MNEILGINNEEESLLFKYGLFIIFFNTINMLIVLFVGKRLDEIYFTSLFMMLYIPIRVIIGGYHCKKSYTCLILFSTIILCIIILYKMNIKYTLFWLSLPLYFFTLYLLKKRQISGKIKFATILYIVEFIVSFSNGVLGSAAFFSTILVSVLYLVNFISDFKNIIILN